MTQRPNEALTEVGTNELEVVEFFVGTRPYVINVAKVREIIQPQKPMRTPETHPCVLGVFRNREDVLPLVDLGRWLGVASEPNSRQARIIVAEFNRSRVGFLVEGVSRIHRVSWTDLEAPDPESMAASRSALGYIRLGKGSGEPERLVFLLDFERIVAELQRNRCTGPLVGRDLARKRRDRVVLIAEDSPLIRKTLAQTLDSGGYEVVTATNGQEAWHKLKGGSRVDAVITDIEMPQMDGHHLTRRIKGDERLRAIPVILYSSMIHEEMRRKGDMVGADAQICKPDLPHLLETVDNLVA